MTIALGSCGGFALGAFATSPAHADHPPAHHHAAEIHAAEIHAAEIHAAEVHAAEEHSPAGTHRWEWLVPDRLERIFGVGWGDGYHACPAGCPRRPIPRISAPAAKRANPLVGWFVRPSRHEGGANVGGVPTTRVKPGRTEIDGVEIDARGAISAFHAPAWHADGSWLAPADSVLDPATRAAPPLSPEAVDAPLPIPELAPAEPPPEAALDECELPAAVEQTYLFDPYPQPKLSDESIPIRSTLLAPLVRPAPLPSVSEAPRPHRLPYDSVAPRTARAFSPAPR